MSTTAPASLLRPRSARLGPAMLGSLTAHALLFGGMILAGLSDPPKPRKPLINPADAMQVGLVTLPKSPTALPERATKAPRAKGVVEPPPAPAPAETPPPPPPAPAERTVVLDDVKPAAQPDTPPPKTKPPAPTPPAPQGDPDAALDALMGELSLDALADELRDAPTGTTDRSASSPDGVGSAPAAGRQGGVVGDAAYSAYIRELQRFFNDRFQPLPALRGKSYLTVVFVEVDAQGNVTAARVLSKSRSPSWDAAALATARAAGRIPLPPERFRDRMSDGYEIHFSE